MYRSLPSGEVGSSPQDIRQFLDNVVGDSRFSEDALVLVAALRKHRTFTYVKPLANMVNVGGVLPKPNGSDSTEVEVCSDDNAVLPWNRQIMEDNPEKVAAYFKELAQTHMLGRIAIIDVGGYFAPFLGKIYDSIGDQFAGVIEDTKNGEKRYEGLEHLPVPVISVAQSENKALENQYVGKEIVSATLKKIDIADKGLEKSKACVLGQGPIGKAIKNEVHNLGIEVSAFDTIASLSDAANTEDALEKVLTESDILFSATGNHALNASNFHLLKPGAEVALATSADDELNLDDLYDLYTVTDLAKSGRMVCKSKNSDHYFFLPDGLKAINFSDHPIDLVSVVPLQTEIILVLKRLLQNGFQTDNVVQRTPIDIKEEATRLFKNHFKEQ